MEHTRQATLHSTTTLMLNVHAPLKKLLVVLTTEWLYPDCSQAKETVVMRSLVWY